jgi:hypothetical protein
MSVTIPRTDRDPDEQVEIESLISEVIDDPDRWLDTPHPMLGGLKPREMIGTDSEVRLRELVRAIKIGMFS